jgi:hypothetical protein
MVLEELAVSQNLVRAGRHPGSATMKDCYLVSTLQKLLSSEVSDETAAADEKNLHILSLRSKPLESLQPPGLDQLLLRAARRVVGLAAS